MTKDATTLPKPKRKVRFNLARCDTAEWVCLAGPYTDAHILSNGRLMLDEAIAQLGAHIPYQVIETPHGKVLQRARRGFLWSKKQSIKKPQ